MIFKQQIRETYVKMSIKRSQTLSHTLISPFTYKSFLKNAQFYVL